MKTLFDQFRWTYEGEPVVEKDGKVSKLPFTVLTVSGPNRHCTITKMKRQIGLKYDIRTEDICLNVKDVTKELWTSSEEYEELHDIKIPTTGCYCPSCHRKMIANYCPTCH